ncbi:MAG TPA: serine/threonine protein kinase, partial [Archangium sp.]|jgi:hypothetical protein
VVGLEGDPARFTARVSTVDSTPTVPTRARALLYGPPPDAEAALVLLGTPGRYVALVHNGAGAPLRLEWALGERRGTMLGHAAASGPADLELEVNDQGDLVASVGRGPDKRTIAEPLRLGVDWQKQFGEVPVPAFGCIEGSCQAENLSYQAKRLPTSAPTAQPVAAVREEPAPPKRPAPKPAPPPRGKRSK